MVRAGLAANAPADAVSFQSISGTSINDLFVTGSRNDGAGVIYHVTNNMATWTEFAATQIGGYYPVWSPRAGVALAAGNEGNNGAPGILRLTTMDQVNQTVTAQVDSKAYSAVQFWTEPDGQTVHFVHIAPPLAGFYTANCN